MRGFGCGFIVDRVVHCVKFICVYTKGREADYIIHTRAMETLRNQLDVSATAIRVSRDRAMQSHATAMVALEQRQHDVGIFHAALHTHAGLIAQINENCVSENLILKRLPNELVNHVLSYLDPRAVMMLGKTCRQFRHLVATFIHRDRALFKTAITPSNMSCRQDFPATGYYPQRVRHASVVAHVGNVDDCHTAILLDHDHEGCVLFSILSRGVAQFMHLFFPFKTLRSDNETFHVWYKDAGTVVAEHRDGAVVTRQTVYTLQTRALTEMTKTRQLIEPEWAGQSITHPCSGSSGQSWYGYSSWQCIKSVTPAAVAFMINVNYVNRFVTGFTIIGFGTLDDTKLPL